MVAGCPLRARLSIRDVPWRILGPIDPSATSDAIVRRPDLPSGMATYAYDQIDHARTALEHAPS